MLNKYWLWPWWWWWWFFWEKRDYKRLVLANLLPMREIYKLSPCEAGVSGSQRLQSLLFLWSCGWDDSTSAEDGSFPADSAHTPCGNLGGFLCEKQTVWQFNPQTVPQPFSISWRGGGKTRNTWMRGRAYMSYLQNLSFLGGIIWSGGEVRGGKKQKTKKEKYLEFQRSVGLLEITRPGGLSWRNRRRV